MSLTVWPHCASQTPTLANGFPLGYPLRPLLLFATSPIGSCTLNHLQAPLSRHHHSAAPSLESESEPGPRHLGA